MVQQRKKAAGPSTKAEAPLVKNFADPAPFFALGAAQFGDAIVVTKVISVVLPLRHLRDKTILHEMVLKKLLHRPFEPSAEDLAQQQTSSGKQGNEDASAPSSSPALANAVYVIVHIASVDIHADTARQVNPQGDVQVNVMATLVAARLQHGLIAGVAETSAFASCMQVRLPAVHVSADVAAANQSTNQSTKDATEALSLDAVKLEGDSQEAESAASQPPPAAAAASGVADDHLRVTARCLEDEPVVPGQAVLLVSEPAAMRCLAIRPPRDAPGPFFFAADTIVGPTGVAVTAAKKAAVRRAARKGAETDEESGVVAAGAVGRGGAGRRVVVVDCDVPEVEGKAEGARKRPRS